MAFSKKTALTLVFALIFGFVAILPQQVQAVGMEADSQCIPANPTPCGCGMELKGQPPKCTMTGNKFGCPCKDVTSGFSTDGNCVATNKCLAKSTGGKDGFGLDQIAKILGDLMGKLMKGGDGSGQPATPPDAGQPKYPPTCTITSATVSTTASSTTLSLTWSSSYDVTTASISPEIGSVAPSGSRTVVLTTATPYSMSVTGPGGTASCNTTGFGGSGSYTGGSGSLSDLLFNTNYDTNFNTGTSTGYDDDYTNTNTNTNSTTTSVIDQINNVNLVTVATTSIASTTVPVFRNTTIFNNAAFLQPGIRGDIQVLGGGATVIVGTRDTSSNSEVAGFYGGNTFNGQPLGVVGTLCRNRPWANNFLSKVLPATFFDSLCSLRGYTVGAPAASVSTTTAARPAVTIVQTPIKPVPNPRPAATSTVPKVEPKVRIWAVPAIVPLGSRTSIFWTSQGVTKCTETSPDGSFSQSSLSGGASTVPLTGSTTYTISCLTADGTPVTNYVTVSISI